MKLFVITVVFKFERLAMARALKYFVSIVKAMTKLSLTAVPFKERRCCTLRNVT